MKLNTTLPNGKDAHSVLDVPDDELPPRDKQRGEEDENPPEREENE